MDKTQILKLAQEHQEAGRFELAEALYQQVLAAEPDHVDALHGAGIAAFQSGRRHEGLHLLRRAVAKNPQRADCHYHLGLMLKLSGQAKEAVGAFEQALAVQPDYPEAWNDLGIALALDGRPADAVAAFERAVSLRPDFLDALGNLSHTLQRLGRWEQAVDAQRRWIALRPHDAESQFHLGNMLHEAGHLEAAIEAFGQAIALKPDFADACYNLGNTLKAKGDLAGAAQAYLRALECQPNLHEAHNNLGNVLLDQGLLDQAMARFRQALLLQPDYLVAHNNLGNALKDAAEIDQALACFDRVLEIDPNYAEVHSNRVYACCFHPDHDSRDILHQTLQWSARHAQPLVGQIRPHQNDPSPQRRLRVGYLTADLRAHPVGRFLLPLLAHHDRQQVEVWAYSGVQIADEVTAQLRANCDVWRDIRRCSMPQIAEQIRQDRIDILVDLSLHMAQNYLLVFARKPAPVQVTYLGYCSTSGMETMDYRLTDPYLDPPGSDLSCYRERSVHLPRTYWCYQPLTTLAVCGLPAGKSGGITFGCFNNYCKVSPPALEAWTRILAAVPNSRLVLFSPVGEHRQKALGRVAAAGVDPRRVIFLNGVPLPQYYQRYQEIDIALDPFPYCGGTTSCDALWMGVPLVTLCGSSALGRGGVSILSNTGLPQLIGQNVDQYVAIAAALAADLPRLAELRRTLRQRMAQSPLMDQPAFARDIEAAYRQMWRTWCGGVAPHLAGAGS